MRTPATCHPARPVKSATAQPLLTLETLEPERPFITIDGVPYELAVLGDFGLVEQARLGRLMTQATTIEAGSGAITGEDEDAARDRELLTRRAVDLLDEAVRMIVRAPRAVLDKLDERQRIQVLQAFVPTVQKVAAPMRPQDHQQKRSTSAGSRRSSARRTASVPG